MDTHTLIKNIYDKIEEIDIFYIAKLKKKELLRAYDKES